ARAYVERVQPRGSKRTPARRHRIRHRRRSCHAARVGHLGRPRVPRKRRPRRDALPRARALRRPEGRGEGMSGIEAVVFDLDGVLVQSEELWDAARRELAEEHDIEWPGDATDAMMGMSSKEWSRYMHDEDG